MEDGSGNSHIVNTLNPDTPAGTNGFKTYIAYGQMFTYSSAINADRYKHDEGTIQRLGMFGIKLFGDFSFTTSNDTSIIGDDDKGQTENGTFNFGGANGFPLSYFNYTGPCYH